MNNLAVKKVLCAVTALFVLTGAVTGGNGIQRKGSRAETLTASAAEDYHSWRQKDPRWADLPLGPYETVGSAGCLVTCLSMIAVMSGVRDEGSFDPGVFVNSMNSVDAFNQWGGIESWASIFEVIPEFKGISKFDFTGTTEEEKAQEVGEWLRQGYYVIVNCNTHHWVVAEGVSEDEIFMIDPASDDTEMFAYYGNAANEYMLVKSSGLPFGGITAPVPSTPAAAAVLAAEPAATKPAYEPAICINVENLPNKTEYEAGEKLDLEGGFAQVSFVDPDKGTVNLPGEYMNGTTYSYGVDVSGVDMSEPGVYPVRLIAYTDLAYTEESFDIIVNAPAATTTVSALTKPAVSTTASKAVTVTAAPEAVKTTIEAVSNSIAATKAAAATTYTIAAKTTAMPVTTAKATEAANEDATAEETDAAEAPESSFVETETAAPTENAETGAAEYYYDGGSRISVLSAPGTSDAVTVATVSGGCVVTVTETENGYGYVVSDSFSGWIDLTGMTKAATEAAGFIAGDINNDGQVDIYDLTLINEYLNCCGSLPEGFSVLRKCELEAADINGDGAVDSEDVLLYLMIICG